MKRLKPEDVESMLFEIQQLFTPSTPIRLVELFAGRQGQIRQLIDSIAEPGRHAILYGERGVGKTSLSQILKLVVPAGIQSVMNIRKACSPDDSFDSIWRKFFKDLRFTHTENGEEQIYTVDEIYKLPITPDDVLREMRQFSLNSIPIFTVDEFNEIENINETSKLFANLIKGLSDEGANCTVVVIGVGDNVSQLFSDHLSISRCTEEILMPRMSQSELYEIIDTRLSQIDFRIDPDARSKIVILSRGLPTYVHRLGKHSAMRATNDLRKHITEEDVDNSIDEIISGSLQSLRDDYEKATSSNQPGNLFKEVLLACALANADDAGYFVPAAVKDPLEKILGRTMTIAQYQNHLNDWHTEKRGEILQRTGESRSYRFRFVEPTMQPYILMRGISEGMIGEDSKSILKFPVQGALFPNEP